jgi:hypothetical protein
MSLKEGKTNTYTATLENASEETQFDFIKTPIKNAEQKKEGVYSAKTTVSTPMAMWKSLPITKGDKVNVEVFAHYVENSTSNTFNFAPFFVSLGQLGSSIGGGETGNNASRLQAGFNFAGFFMPTNQNQSNSLPKAYLYYRFYNEAGLPTGEYGYKAVTPQAKISWESLALSGIEAKENGTIEIFVFNESNTSVWFDNLTLTYQQNLICQENHYDPWGLNLAGIEKAGKPDNKFQYNGKEKVEEFGLGWSDYFDNPIRFIDPDGMKAIDGVFIDEKGNVVGNDGKNDNRVYVIKTTQTKFDSGVASAGISKQDAKDTKNFIEANSGNASAFESNDIAYRNSVEIEGSSETRQQMVNIVNKDNGKGGKLDANNREYGGTISNSGVVSESPMGDVTNPCTDTHASIANTISEDTKSTFHSHPSGNVFTTTKTNATYQAEIHEQNCTFNHAPSNGMDVHPENTSMTNYVFARGSGTVYIYNSQSGVVATLPQRYFVHPKQ